QVFDEVKMWDAQTGQQLPPPFQGHTAEVGSVAFSPNGQRLASAGRGIGTIDKQKKQFGEGKGWEAQTGRLLLTIHSHTGWAHSVAWSPDGQRLASASGDLHNYAKPGEVKVWEAQTGKPLLTLPGHTGAVRSVAFSPDGKHLASAGVGVIGVDK